MTLPQGFLDHISRYPELEVLRVSLLTEPDVAVRINRAKDHDTEIPPEMRVDWCAEGMYLPERKKFTFDPAMHQGLYYVQDASSMSITAAIRQICPSEPVAYLDCCAAPGGKTTAAISALAAGSLVVANEYDYKRAEILAENVSKWGNANVAVSRGDTAKLRKLKERFDIVAVDAPCSGEGMMRKEPKAAEQWSEALVRDCAATQREILANAWHALKPGGHLIYSTCTFNRHEDEENLQWAVDELGMQPVEIDALKNHPDVTSGIDTPLPCYRFLPGRIKGEGLFMAVLKKDGDGYPKPLPRSKPQKIDAAIEKTVKSWICSEVELLQSGPDIYAVPLAAAPLVKEAAGCLDMIQPGVHAATVKGKDVIPTHQLILSDIWRKDSFPRCDVDYDTAIKYLQKEALTLPEGTPKGYVALFYSGHPLGIVKNLGNRSNNLLPKNWRIVSRL